MRFKKAACVALIALSAQSLSASPTVFGTNMKCSQWLYPDSNDIQISYLTYVLGVMTGTAMSTYHTTSKGNRTVNLLEGVSAKDIAALIERECQDDPTQSLFSVSVGILSTLAEKVANK